MASGVVTTLHNEAGDRCVKILRRPGGGFGLQEFRRDVEDAGGWTLVSDAPRAVYASEAQATAAARAGIAWLREGPVAANRARDGD